MQSLLAKYTELQTKQASYSYEYEEKALENSIATWDREMTATGERIES